MSEIKGTLLSIILTITVFGIVFGAITIAIKENTKKVSDRFTEAVEIESDDDELAKKSAIYELHY